VGDSTLLICLGIVIGIVVVLVLLAILRKGSGGSASARTARREPVSKDEAKRAKPGRPIDAKRAEEKRAAAPDRGKSRGRPDARDADERMAGRRDKSEVSKTAKHVKKQDPAKEPFRERAERRRAFEDRGRDARDKGVVPEKSKPSDKQGTSDDPKSAGKSRRDGKRRKPPK
jgi:hypothetical protein